MFTESAEIYDAINPPDAQRAERLDALIRQHHRGQPNTLLDVACGTGAALEHLRGCYAVEGLDLDAGMLAVARRKLPDVPLHQADLVNFDLGRQFDAVLCLGSSIGYTRTLPRLRQAMATLARHTRPGGVVVVEPWFPPKVWEAGRLTVDHVDQPGLKIARLLVSGQRDRVSTLDIHYLVGRPEGVRSFTEHHELGLFTHDDHLDAFRRARLDLTDDRPPGLAGRAFYVAVKPTGGGTDNA